MAKLSLQWVSAFAFAVAVASGPACADSGAVEDDDAGTSSSASSSGMPQIGSSSSSSSGDSRNDPAYAEAPVLSVIEPTRATVGSAGPTLVVRGRNFVERTIVQLDGAELQTSFIDTTELRATMPTEKLAAPGVLVVSVGTSPPGGGASSSMDFTVENPVPTLTRVSDPDPPSVAMGSAARSIVLEGAGFVPGAKVRWVGQELPTTFVSSTSLSAEVDAPRLADSGIFELDVANPAPGGGVSARLTFVVSNPSVQLDAIEPATAVVGSNALVVTLTGSGFVANKSKVVFNGSELVPEVTSPSTMTVTLQSQHLQTVAAYPVAIQNPNPGGGLSGARIFSVVNPAPRVTSLSPSSVTAGAGVTTVTARGSGFVPTTSVTIRGTTNTPAAATFVSSEELRFDIQPAQLAVGGVGYDIRLENPGPGGGSASLPFNVRNVGATIDNVVIDDAETDGFVIGQAGVARVTGAGFLAASQIMVTGATLVSSVFVNPSQMLAYFTPTQANLTFQVIGDNPSNIVSRTACNLSAGAWTLPQVGAYFSTSGALFSGAQAKLFSGSTGKQCSSVTLRADLQPYAAVAVQNTSGVPATLEAWAICSGQFDDAYLALYPRATVPGDAERNTCTGVVSNGGNSQTGTPPWYSLQNAGNSRFCPGLWGRDEQGISHGGPSIPACGTYVAYIQQDRVSTPSHTAPQGLTVGLFQQ